MDIFLFIILMICGFVGISGFYNAIKDNFFNNNNVNITTKTSVNTVSEPFSYRSEVQNLKNQIEEDKNKLSKYEKQLRENKQIIENLEYGLLEKDELYENLQKKTQKSVDFLTSMISDHNTLQEQLTEKYLKTKKQPAHNEAIRIKEIREISKLHIEKYKLLLYKYEYLLNIFPDLTNYVDSFDSLNNLAEQVQIKSITNFKNEYDHVTKYITKREYQSLNVTERNQLALEKYIKGAKSDWQIGRDYELYVGHIYSTKKWKVEYFGIEHKLKDMGRDLIAIKGNNHHVIQCKYWSQEKIIHEKHLFQLFGTSTIYQMEIGDAITVRPVFYTNTKLSDKAKYFADLLQVEYHENIPIKDFPRIKCNLNKDMDGMETKIYHLPFDQQYDKTKINKRGEYFVYSVKEAEEKGFRRAFRFFG